MPPFPVFSDIFSFSFMRYAFFASICIGILCPTIGIFIVLRRFSLLGDTLAHASLAGAATGILCSGNPILYAIGYSVAAGAGIDLLQSRFPRRSDLTLAIVLALSAGIAVTLMSSGLLHANAESFLFGSILTVDRSDAIAILVLTAAAVLLIGAVGKVKAGHVHAVGDQLAQDIPFVGGRAQGADDLRFSHVDYLDLSLFYSLS